MELWENPPVRSFYFVFACLVSGCNEAAMEYVKDIPY
jgi:hypothetical protein